MKNCLFILIFIGIVTINNVYAQKNSKLEKFFSGLESSEFIIAYDSITGIMEKNAKNVKQSSYMYDSVSLNKYINEYNKNTYLLQDLLRAYLDTLHGFSSIPKKLLLGKYYDKIFTEDLDAYATNYTSTMDYAYAHLEYKDEYKGLATSPILFFQIFKKIFTKTFEWVIQHKQVLNEIKKERINLVYEQHKMKKWDKI